MDDDRHDSMLMEILKERKTVVGFLESIFGFLSRRTDFYLEQKSPADKVGFPVGMKEKVTINVLRKYDQNFREYFEKTNPDTFPSEVAQIVEVTEEESKLMEAEEDLKRLKSEMESKRLENDDKLKSNLKTKLVNFEPAEYYNGSVNEKYAWSQTICDFEIHIMLPEHIKSGKQLKTIIGQNLIRIEDKTKENEIIFEGKMSFSCRHSEAVWSISGGKLQITLDKIKEMWWDRLFEDEEKIDLTKVDCSRDVAEMSEDYQAAIEKIRWDQKQKALGLPTSEQLKKEETLKKAWNAEGSPFKGQAFDPSIVRFDD